MSLELKTKILNEELKSYFKPMEDSFNRNSIPRDELGRPSTSKKLTKLGEAQTVKPSQDAFALQSPKEIELEEVTNSGNIYVVHRKFKMKVYNDLLENPRQDNIKKHLHLVVKEMYLSFRKEIPFGPETVNKGIYLTFQRPGDGEYLRFDENGAFVTLRLYSDCESLEQLND